MLGSHDAWLIPPVDSATDPDFFRSGVNAMGGLGVLSAVAAREGPSSWQQHGQTTDPGQVGDALALAVVASPVDMAPGPTSAEDQPGQGDARPVGFESRPQGGTEEATVGLRRGGCGSQEEFGLVLCDVFRTEFPKLVGLASIWLGGGAEDAVQDAFVDVWSSWDRIRDTEKVVFYLRRAVVNNAMSELRHRRVVRRVHPGLSRHAPNQDRGRLMWSSTTPPGPEDEALRQVADEAIVVCIRRLAPQQAACVALRFYLGLSEKEIAEVREISTGAVKKHISRAMRNLRPLLEENGD